jgi:hypothetical protein
MRIRISGIVRPLCDGALAPVGAAWESQWDHCVPGMQALHEWRHFKRARVCGVAGLPELVNSSLLHVEADEAEAELPLWGGAALAGSFEAAVPLGSGDARVSPSQAQRLPVAMPRKPKSSPTGDQPSPAAADPKPKRGVGTTEAAQPGRMTPVCGEGGTEEPEQGAAAQPQASPLLGGACLGTAAATLPATPMDYSTGDAVAGQLASPAVGAETGDGVLPSALALTIQATASNVGTSASGVQELSPERLPSTSEQAAETAEGSPAVAAQLSGNNTSAAAAAATMGGPATTCSGCSSSPEEDGQGGGDFAEEVEVASGSGGKQASASKLWRRAQRARAAASLIANKREKALERAAEAGKQHHALHGP